jgi:ADP-ribose pyrophosphatase
VKAQPKLAKATGKRTVKAVPKAVIGKAKVARAAAKPVAKAKRAKAAVGVKAKGIARVKAVAVTGKEKSAQLLDSKVAFDGPLFRVVRDHLIEPGGRESHRDVIRHNGSVAILAVDPGKKKKDPWIVIERQYRHAAGQYLWELPAGKLDAG